MPDAATIAIVGHCGADAYSLSNLVHRVLPQVHTVIVDEESPLAALQRSSAVWLVNRVLDGRFADRRGVELIRRYRREGGAIMVLISNYADAQAQAVAAGAVEGFGKSELGSPRVAQLLRSLIDASPANASHGE